MSQGWGNQGGKPPGQGWGGQGGQQGWGGQQGGQQGLGGQQGGQQGWGGQQGGQQGWGGQQGGQQGWGGHQGGHHGAQQGWGGQKGGQQGFGGNQGFNQPQQGFSQSTSTSNLFNPNQDYIIQSALSDNRVLDISQGNDSSKNTLIIWSPNGDKNQRFRFREVGGKYQIVNGTGAVLTVPNGNTSNGTQLVGAQANNGPNQSFEIYPAQNVNGGYIIKTFSGKVLDICEGKTSTGTPVIQYDYNGGKNQTWIIRTA